MLIDKRALRVAIVGGGPGGLCLAKLLQTKGFAQVKIYETDASPTARQQGGLLDLKPESGQRAIKEAGLYDAWLGAVASADSPLTIKDKTGQTLLQIRRSATPEIERQTLKMLLLNSLQPETIRYGAKFTSLQNDDAVKVLSFHGHADVVADLVVGADGAWSKVRPCVHDVKPKYSGVTFIDGKILSRTSEIKEAMGPAVLIALADSKGILAGPLSPTTASVYAASRKDEAWHKTPAIANAPRETLLKHSMDLYADWSPALQKVVASIEPSTIVLRPIYFLTPGLSWATKPSVTLIGDAAHLMSPFAGEGVNMAFWDAMTLASALAAGGDLDMALAAYEKAMFAEAKIKTAESAKNLDLFFREENAVQGVLALFNGG